MSVRRMSAVLLTVLSVFGWTASAKTELPYETYTYSEKKEELASPAAYLPGPGYSELKRPGTGAPVRLVSPSDMEVLDGGALAVLDSGAGTVYLLDGEMNVTREITGFTQNGQKQAFTDAQGIAVSPQGELYVADTEHSRIVRMKPDGSVIQVYGAPDIQALEEGYRFFPAKIAVDRAGRMYIAARGLNYGLLVLDSEGTFLRFMGAPRVTVNLLTMMWKAILPRKAAETLTNFVPTEFSNLAIDPEGFVYTTIKANDAQKLYSAIRAGGQETVKAVQRFNAKGDDVLRRFGTVPVVGDLNWHMPSVSSSGVQTAADLTEGPSTFEDIVMDGAGCYYCVDSYRGRIFAYDADGNLLYAFGNASNQEGTVQMASALALFGEKLLVLDRASGRIVSYAKTPYGSALESAAKLFSAGRYPESLEKWREVARYNGNLTLAYAGIGKSAYRTGDYETAMQYLRLAGEKQYFSKAFEASRNGRLQNHFIWVFAAAAAVVLLILLYGVGVVGRKKPAFRTASHGTLSESLRYSRYLTVHPFRGFRELKWEGYGSARAATLLLALTAVSYVFSRQYSGYLFSGYDPASYNALTELLKILLPVLLWVVANWCLTTLMDGEGTMRDIYIATCYSLTPAVLTIAPLALASNFMGLSEQSYHSFVTGGVLVWIALLLFIGTMITHQYSLVKTAATSLLIILAMAIIVFIGILFYNLLQRMISFLLSSWQELAFRKLG